jgi:spermidine synthase
MTKKSKRTGALPEVTLSDGGGIRYLHLDSIWVQGSMQIAKPFDLHLEYIQRMMAPLLFLPADKLQTAHAVQLGLGSAALTKFCHRRLPWQVTAIELNPHVVAACRRSFKLPDDDDRLTVQIADAGDAIQTLANAVDVLHVDLYDQHAEGPVLDSAEFYRHCAHALRPGGAMAVNLFGRVEGFDASLQRLAKAFGANNLRQFKPTREGNTVVLGLKAPTEQTAEQLRERAAWIKAELGLPAQKWVKALG